MYIIVSPEYRKYECTHTSVRRRHRLAASIRDMDSLSNLSCNLVGTHTAKKGNYRGTAYNDTISRHSEDIMRPKNYAQRTLDVANTGHTNNSGTIVQQAGHARRCSSFARMSGYIEVAFEAGYHGSLSHDKSSQSCFQTALIVIAI